MQHRNKKSGWLFLFVSGINRCCVFTFRSQRSHICDLVRYRALVWSVTRWLRRLRPSDCCLRKAACPVWARSLALPSTAFGVLYSESVLIFIGGASFTLVVTLVGAVGYWCTRRVIRARVRNHDDYEANFPVPGSPARSTPLRQQRALEAPQGGRLALEDLVVDPTRFRSLGYQSRHAWQGEICGHWIRS